VLASQALQRVLGIARQNREDVGPPENDQEKTEFAHDEEAITLCEQILTVAVPIARFRCYVTVEQVSPKAKIGLGDYAISGIDIPAIKNGLIGLSMEFCNVYIQLWEHREEGKFDMLCGYQGQTKNLGFRNWLKDIDRHNQERPTNVIEQRNGSSHS
jgi:hypothetical protein